MAGFNFTSPTAATPGFNFSPAQPYSPELLAQIAQASFRPPALMQMPGMQPMQMQQSRGAADIMSGIDALGAGLAKGLGGLGDGGISAVGPQGSGVGGSYTPADAAAMVWPTGVPGAGGAGMGGLDDASLMTIDGPLGGMPGSPQGTVSIWDRIAQQLKRTGLF